MKDYPKILLLCSFNRNSANGITIKNLFGGWPKDRIGIVDFKDQIHVISIPEIDRYYILGREEVEFIWPFKYFRKTHRSEAYDKVTVETRPPPQKTNGRRKASHLKSFLLRIQREFLYKTGIIFVTRHFRVSKKLEAWVRAYDPDIIYCSTGDISKMVFFQDLISQVNVKGAFHVFDDFINSRYEDSLFPNYWSNRLDRAFRGVLDSCELHLTISQKMADEYGLKYGKSFHAFHNPIDPLIWCQNIPPELDETDSESNQAGAGVGESLTIKEQRPFVFVYAGKVNRETKGPIELFIEAVRVLRDGGLNVELRLYSPYSYEELKAALGNRLDEVYKGNVPYSDLPSVFRSADALLLPLDFTEKAIKYIRLSMLTKVTEYMISGTPIFAFAPSSLATTDYLREREAAYFCDDPGSLLLSIKTFVSVEGHRKQIARNALLDVEKNHLTKVVNERLRLLLSEMIPESKDN